jgi:hypothetical protein
MLLGELFHVSLFFMYISKNLIAIKIGYFINYQIGKIIDEYDMINILLYKLLKK